MNGEAPRARWITMLELVAAVGGGGILDLVAAWLVWRDFRFSCDVTGMCFMYAE